MFPSSVGRQNNPKLPQIEAPRKKSLLKPLAELVCQKLKAQAHGQLPRLRLK
jgi:hypothetical protein